MARDTDRTTADDETTEDEGPRQTVRLMAEDISPDVGPYFPSGMSAPEAAIAGATEGLSDDDVEEIRKRSGLELGGGGESETKSSRKAVGRGAE